MHHSMHHPQPFSCVHLRTKIIVIRPYAFADVRERWARRMAIRARRRSALVRISEYANEGPADSPSILAWRTGHFTIYWLGHYT